MSVTIPVRNDFPDYEFEVDLDGRTFGLRFRYNVRDGFWYADLRDADGAALALGRRVVLDTPMFRFGGAAFPPGMLIANSTTNDKSPPGPADFGTRVRLLYFSESELEG
jgi:hypothetical protein